MSKKSNMKLTVFFVLSVSLIVAAVVTFFLTLYYRHVCFQTLGGFCERMNLTVISVSFQTERQAFPI